MTANDQWFADQAAARMFEAREEVDCERCCGSGRIEHLDVFTGPNPCGGGYEACDDCDGLGKVAA